MLSSGLLGMSAIVVRVSTLAMMALLVRGSGVAAVGYYGLATLAASLVAIGLSFGMPTYLTRQFPAGLVSAKEVSRIHLVRLGLLAVATLVAVPIIGTVVPGSVSAGFLLFFMASLLEQWNETAWVKVRGTAKAWRESAVNSVFGFSTVAACAVDLWMLDGLTFLDAATYVLVAATLRSVLAAVATRTGGPATTAGTQSLAGHAKQAAPYLVSDLLGLVYLRGSVAILAFFVTANQLGEFVSASGFITPAVQVASAMGMGALAYAAPRSFAGGADATEPRVIYEFFQQAGLAAAGLISIALPLGVAILFGDEGHLILRLALILTLFLAMRFANFGLSAVLLAQGGAARRVLVLLASIAVSVPLNVGLAKLFGAEGSAWAALLTELVVAASLLFACRRRELIAPVVTTSVAVGSVAAATVAGTMLLSARWAAFGVGLCYLGVAAWFTLRRRLGRVSGIATAPRTEEVA
jgi:O-antigen/teichoic acid export membrane protein